MLQLADVVDVLLVGLLLWLAIVWLRRSRARFALIGVAIVGLIYLLARRLDLEMTAWILQGFFAVFVIFMVVVFQEDLRRLFEQIAIRGLRRRAPIPPSPTVDTIVRAVAQMASTRTGALLVIPGREPLDRFLEGGVSLDAWVSEPLLLSLFDSSTPGHDGAVIFSNNRATRFGVHLPLSADLEQIGPGGTRHAAALGLAERSDAFCIAVSEERGSLSVACDGALRALDSAEDLAAELRRFLDRNLPAPTEAGRWAAIRRHLPEGGIALAVSVALWLLLVPGGSTVQVQREAEVVVDNLPAGYELLDVDPRQVEVTLSGERREIVFGDLDDLEVHIDALLVELGRRTFALTPDQVHHPETLRVTSLSPKQVKLSVRRQSGG